MKRLAVTVMALALSAGLYAQDNGDWGGSVGFDLSKKFYKSLTLSFAEEFRTRENMGTVDRFSHALDLSYKPFSFLKVGGAYNLINYNHPTKSWEIRHRYFLYATGSYTLGSFTLSLRERFQSTYREGVEATEKRANPKLYLRSRLQLEYNMSSLPLTPYTSVEFFGRLNDPQENGIDQVRVIGGLEYSFSKRNALDLFYRYSNKIDEDAGVGNLIGVEYKHKF